MYKEDSVIFKQYRHRHTQTDNGIIINETPCVKNHWHSI